MMKFFGLNERAAKQARKLPQLAGKPLIGRGTTAAVFDNGDTVLKLTSCEKTYRVFNDGAVKCEGPHFPKTVNNWGQVGTTKAGDPLYLFEQEKLEKLPLRKRSLPVVKEYRDFRTRYQKARWATYKEGTEHAIDVADRLSHDLELSPSVSEAFNSLAEWISDHGDAILDLHSDNVMMRPSTGEMVFVDPVVSDSQLSKARRRHGW
jgi:hypothetical protein